MEHEKLYAIESRYQHITKEGVVWTKWFVELTSSPSADITSLEQQISSFKEIDKRSKMKLKHEYRISEWEDPGEVHAFQRMYSRRRNKAKKEAARGL